MWNMDNDGVVEGREEELDDIIEAVSVGWDVGNGHV